MHHLFSSLAPLTLASEQNSTPSPSIPNIWYGPAADTNPRSSACCHAVCSSTRCVTRNSKSTHPLIQSTQARILIWGPGEGRGRGRGHCKCGRATDQPPRSGPRACLPARCSPQPPARPTETPPSLSETARRPGRAWRAARALRRAGRPAPGPALWRTTSINNMNSMNNMNNNDNVNSVDRCCACCCCCACRRC